MGGIGKTQLAVEFAYRYGTYFRGVHWLNLADPSQLEAEIARCGREMRLPNFPEDQPTQVTLTLHTWKSDGPRLLILDNFEEPARANDVLHLLGHSSLRLLITSRRTDWLPATGLKPLPLEVFTPQESLDFLKSALDKRHDSDPDLANLAERLGHLPLALELASRYLNGHPRLSLDDYLTQSREALDHPSMHGWRADLPAPTEHDLDLQRTFALSWNALHDRPERSTAETKDETAQKIFLMAGYLAPNSPIPLEIFEKTLEIPPETCDEALSTLYGLGLLKEGETNLPAIHPLLSAYARGLAKEDEEILEKLADAFGTLSNKTNQTGLPYKFVLLRPHMPILAEHAAEVKLEDAGTLWNNFGYFLYMIADHSGARAAYERALKIDEAAFGPEHPTVAIRVNNLGGVLQILGDLAGAKTAYIRALEIRKDKLGDAHPDTITTLNDLGQLCTAEGNLADAKTYLEQALLAYERILGKEHRFVATAINNLGAVLNRLGDLAGAKAAYQRALKIRRDKLGDAHPETATTLNDLGDLYRAYGNLTEARNYLEEALKVYENVFGREHPWVAVAVNNLGSVLYASGDLAGARAAYERALKIDEANFGPDHPSVATDVNNLGGVLYASGDLAGAKAAFERALAIFKKFLPPNHPNIKTVQGNLDSLE